MRIAYSLKGSILIVGSFYYRFTLDAVGSPRSGMLSASDPHTRPAITVLSEPPLRYCICTLHPNSRTQVPSIFSWHVKSDFWLRMHLKGVVDQVHTKKLKDDMCSDGDH